MYRFLIIDDEPVVREGIAQAIDWQAHGFELVGTCRDGREGMQAIDDLRPDVVLTDICMPFVDGLELASFVAARYPATRTILLTGYDEFEYAKEAVRLRVQNFLLKPITPSELRTELDAVREELDAARDREAHYEQLRAQLRESLPMIRERLLNRLIHGALSAADLPRRLEALDIDLPGPCWIALVCDPDTVDAEEELAELAVQNVAAEVAGELGEAVAFATPKVSIVAIVSGADVEKTAARALECAEQIADRSVSELGVTVSIGVGDPVRALDEVGDSYDEARSALAHRLVLGPNHIITIDQVRGTPTAHTTGDSVGAGDARAASQSSPDARLRARYVTALTTGTLADSAAAIGRLVEAYQERGMSAETCHAAMHRLLAEALNALESIGVDSETVPGIDPNPFEQLSQLKTLADMRHWFTRLAEDVHTFLESRRSRHSHVKAVEAEHYIRNHYMDGDLSLSEVCRELAVSKSYFSPLFKAHTGMTFVEFLTTVRMERAKELLAADDLKTYEIAQMVGFSDAHYFSLTFRKQIGVSPTEFRERLRSA